MHNPAQLVQSQSILQEVAIEEMRISPKERGRRKNRPFGIRGSRNRYLKLPNISIPEVIFDSTHHYSLSLLSFLKNP